jgi:hypothetical protein
MALYLPIRAISRSQNVRIGGTKITRDTTHFVDISVGATRRDLERHQALGAVIVVGPLSAQNSTASSVVSEERTFTETTGAGVYTGSVVIPAEATLTNIIISGVALWTATTSATLKVGDAADDDGFFTAVDLKATDLLAGETLTLFSPGGQQGAYVVPGAADDAYQITTLYSATARVISGVVTTVGAAGNAGRTRMTVVYSLPISTDVVAATKV